MNTILTISDNIKSPARPGDVGYNLLADEDCWVRPNEVARISTGVKIKLPDGYWAEVTARSSAVFRYSLIVHRGIIDNGFVGELIVTCTAIERQIHIKKGMSIAQLILHPIVTPVLERVESLPLTERGEQGFGSTGLVHPEELPSGPGNLEG